MHSAETDVTRNTVCLVCLPSWVTSFPLLASCIVAMDPFYRLSFILRFVLPLSLLFDTTSLPLFRQLGEEFLLFPSTGRIYCVSLTSFGIPVIMTTSQIF